MKEMLGPVQALLASMDEEQKLALIRDIPSVIGALPKDAGLPEFGASDAQMVCDSLSISDATVQAAQSAAPAGTPEDMSPVTAVVRLHGYWRAVPPKAKQTFCRALPGSAVEKGLPTILRALDSMNSVEFEGAAAKIVEALPALEEMKKMVGSAASKDVSEQPATKQRCLEGARLLHHAFLAVPPQTRNILAEALPDQARPMLEMVEGVDDAGLEQVVDMVVLAQKSQEPSLACGEHAQVITEAGADDTPLPPLPWCITYCCCCMPESLTSTPEFRAGVLGGGMVLRSEMRRVSTWVRRGPCTLRVLTFLAGVSCLVAGALGIVIQILGGFRLVAVMLDMYLSLGGFLVAAMEVKSKLCSDRVARLIMRWCAFLSRAVGRGFFLIGLSLLSLATLRDSGNGVGAESLNILAAGFAAGLGIFNLVVWRLVAYKLRQLRSVTPATEAQVRDLFADADIYGTGKLDPGAVVSLLSRLQPPTILSDSEAHAAILQLDADHNGYIDAEELVAWWCGSGDGRWGSSPSVAVAGTASAPQNSGSVQRIKESVQNTMVGQFSLRAVSLLCGIAYATSGAISLLQEFDSAKNMIRIFIDAAICVSGLLVVALEARAVLFGCSIMEVVTREFKLLSRVWGRGLFYMFLATLALSKFDLTHLANILVGFILLAVGVFNLVVGGKAEMEMMKVGVGDLDPARMREEFTKADSDANGVLDSAELPQLMKALGLEMSREHMEVALLHMDLNGDGVISWREFLEWSQGSELDIAAQILAGSNAAATGAAMGSPLLPDSTIHR